MNILGIDSSTGKLSVAINQNERLLSEIVSCKGMEHMVNVMDLLDRALRRAKLTLKDIDIFGVNLGPGDFTGTRIGISIIKTLSWLERKPAFGINSLDIFALGISLKNSNFIAHSIKKNIPVLIMPCLDVRRGEVYFAFYNITSGRNSEGKYLARIETGGRYYFINKVGENFLIHHSSLEELLGKLTESRILRIPESRDEYKDPRVLIGGNCYVSYGKVLSDVLRQSSIFNLDKKVSYPQARYLNICAYFNAAGGVETGNLIPVYVREFVPFSGR